MQFSTDTRDSSIDLFRHGSIVASEAGFYVTKPFQRFLANRVYYSRWAKDNAGAGIWIGPEASPGTYVGNHFTAKAEHGLAKAFDSNLEGACIVGSTYFGAVYGGKP